MSEGKETGNVSMDALATLGTLIGESCGRDAVHIAVEPCVAATNCYPGDHVGFVDGGVGRTTGETLGIVDPFLREPVMKGQRFWLFVYPRQITSLRHVWSHPKFPDVPFASIAVVDRVASEQWLRDFAANVPGIDYEVMIEAATSEKPVADVEWGHGCIDENAVFIYGTDASGEIPPEFWIHLQNVTGKVASKRPFYFRCGC